MSDSAIVIESDWKEIAKTDISLFENETGYELTGDLLEFYKKSNGGFPSGICANSPVFVQYIFPLICKDSDCAISIRSELMFELDLPDQYLPFASTGESYAFVCLKSGTVRCDDIVFKSLNDFFCQVFGQSISHIKVTSDEEFYERYVDDSDFEQIRAVLDSSVCSSFDIWFSAILKGNFDVIEFLVSNGYDVTGLLHKYMKIDPSPGGIDRLISAGIKINDLDNNGIHILEVREGWEDVLIKRGAIRP